MVKGLGAFKVRRPGLIPQAGIKCCGPPGSARAGGHQGQGFAEPWPTRGAPKGLQVGSRRPTLRRAPRGASLPTPTATPPEVSKQAGLDWLEQPSGDTGPSGCERGAGWPPIHPREPLYPFAPLSFYDAMNGGGYFLNTERKKESEVTQSCPTLCDPMDCSPHQAPLSMGFSRQDLQEWVAISSFRGSS